MGQGGGGGGDADEGCRLVLPDVRAGLGCRRHSLVPGHSQRAFAGGDGGTGGSNRSTHDSGLLWGACVWGVRRSDVCSLGALLQPQQRFIAPGWRGVGGSNGGGGTTTDFYRHP